MYSVHVCVSVYMHNNARTCLCLLICRFATVSCPLCRDKVTEKVMEVDMQRATILNQMTAQSIQADPDRLIQLLNLDREKDFANLAMLGVYMLSLMHDQVVLIDLETQGWVNLIRQSFSSSSLLVFYLCYCCYHCVHPPSEVLQQRTQRLL